MSKNILQTELKLTKISPRRLGVNIHVTMEMLRFYISATHRVAGMP